MTVKISGTFPKEPPAINGLEAHHEEISSAFSPSDETNWTGYAVVKLSVKESTEKANGAIVTTLWIDHVEVMDGHRLATAKRMLNDTFNERVAEPGPDSYAERFNDDHDAWDPYENPDEASELHHGRPVERVDLPDGESATARERATERWSQPESADAS